MRQSRLDKQVERSLVALMEAEEAEKVLAEQVDTWSEIRDDLRTRALVSETPLASAEYDEMERQLTVASAALRRQHEEVASRRHAYEELLESWQPEEVV